MLVTADRSRRNRNYALALAGAMAGMSALAGWFWPPALLSLALCPLIYWLVRRRCVRRLRIMEQPFTRCVGTGTASSRRLFLSVAS
jgi:hypothetical protein